MHGQPQPIRKQPHVGQQQLVLQRPELEEREEEVVQLRVGGGGEEEGATIDVLQGLPELAGVDNTVHPCLLQFFRGRDPEFERQEVIQPLGTKQAQVPIDLTTFPEGGGEEVPELVAF